MQPVVRLNPQPQYEVIPSNVVKKDGIINLNCNWSQQPNPMTVTLNFIKQVISMQMVIKPKGNMPGMPVQGMHPGMQGMQPGMMPQGMNPQFPTNPQSGTGHRVSNPAMNQFPTNPQFAQPTNNFMPNMNSNQPMNMNKQNMVNKVFDECMQFANG